MASKETYVAPAPDIQHLTPPGCHLCIGIHVCMLAFIRFGKFRLWFQKKPGHRTNFQKSIDQNQSFFLALFVMYGGSFRTYQNKILVFVFTSKRKSLALFPQVILFL